MQNKAFYQLDSILDHTDSAKTFQFLDEVNNNGPVNEHFIARLNCLKAQQLYQKNFQSDVSRVKDEVKRLFTEALHKAYESEDDRLIAFVSWRYGKSTRLCCCLTHQALHLGEDSHCYR